jgi:hypothetical protein
MDDVTKKLIRELEQIQTIGHLLRKAGEADAEVAMSGWALEGAGRMIVDSASEITETLVAARDAKPADRSTSKKT